MQLDPQGWNFIHIGWVHNQFNFLTINYGNYLLYETINGKSEEIKKTYRFRKHKIEFTKIFVAEFYQKKWYPVVIIKWNKICIIVATNVKSIGKVSSKLPISIIVYQISTLNPWFHTLATDEFTKKYSG